MRPQRLTRCLLVMLITVGAFLLRGQLPELELPHVAVVEEATPPAAPASPAPSTSPTRSTSTSLVLSSTEPTLVVGNGARIESVDPATGRVLASIEPLDVADLRWKRFLRRGRFLLAEGWSDIREGPVPYFDRGLVLLDETGAVRWTHSQAFPRNGFATTLYLGDDGSVGLDGHEGPGIILVDGTKVETPAVPAGPVVNGIAPLSDRGEESVPLWFYVAEQLTAATKDLTASARNAIEQGLVTEVSVGNDKGSRRASIFIELAPEPASEDAMYRRTVKTVARVPLPHDCQQNTWLQPTLARDTYVLRCTSWKDYRIGPPHYFTLNLRTRRLAPVRPPRGDNESRVVGVTVDADNTVIAAVSSGCDTTLHAAVPGKRWRRLSFQPMWGSPFAPTAFSHSIMLQPTDFPSAGNHGCIWSAETRPTVQPSAMTYLRRPDGTWLALPYRLGSTVSANRSWAVTSDGTAVARLDREERVVLPERADRLGPSAWLP
jgi:hypothetical protein